LSYTHTGDADARGPIREDPLFRVTHCFACSEPVIPKFVKRWTKRLVAVLGAALCLAAGGCREDTVRSQATAAAVDNEARQACATFTAGYGRATTTAKRLALADDVNRWSAGSDNPAIVKRGTAVGRSADEGNRAWRAAATEFQRVCRQAGWRPNQRR
jgi:hypothetical protein